MLNNGKKNNILILTQRVDKNNPVLGFFHRWVEEFAKHYEQVTVIALGVGEYDFPANVKILSLGKENVESSVFNIFRKIKYVWNFYKYIWKERKNYDAVFVHMNQEYVLLGGLFWKVIGKKIYMWRNHLKGNIFTRIAVFLSNSVFCTSEFSFTAKFKKTKIMPVGIDTSNLKSQISNFKIKNTILSLGRIDPVKHIDMLIDALGKIDVDYVANIYGEGTEISNLKSQIAKLKLENKITLYGNVPNYKTPEIYNENEIFVNLTESGSFDKTILEAMVCGCIPLVRNESLRNILGDKFLFIGVNDLAEKIKNVFNMPENEKDEYRKKFQNYVIENHSLNKLMTKITEIVK